MTAGARPDTSRPPATDTLADILRGLRPAVSSSLLDGRGWQRVLNHLQDSPATAVRLFGLEIRLADPAPVADLAIPVSPDSPTAAHFIAAGAAADRHSDAARLARCISEMSRAGSPLAQWVTSAFLEYDIAALPPGTAAAAPGVCLALRSLPSAEAGHPAPDTIAAALADVAGWAHDVREQRAVQRAFDALPPDATIAWAGALPGRGLRAIKLVTRGVDGPATPGFLARLRWPGSIKAVADVLSIMTDVCSPALLQLSFNLTRDGPLPALGLELFVGTKPVWLTSGRDDWRPLVVRLVREGWCLPDKAQGLLAWPGREKFFTAQGPLLVHRGINHVKLSIKDGSTSAKAYVGVGCFPIGGW
ncbi:MAG: hypothetical protein OXE53_14000 [Deltaproteobacteria bacterium]|nr:hypothetical protein [Deltaproteobacteria bacterium]